VHTRVRHIRQHVVNSQHMMYNCQSTKYHALVDTAVITHDIAVHVYNRSLYIDNMYDTYLAVELLPPQLIREVGQNERLRQWNGMHWVAVRACDTAKTVGRQRGNRPIGPVTTEITGKCTPWSTQNVTQPAHNSNNQISR
jgi:hypothetical protein